MRAADLNCMGAAQAGAEALEKAFTTVVFTSGRRGVQDQARAMASNIVRNREWIVQTYVSTESSHALQAWVDTHPSATTQPAIAEGLALIMDGWTDDQKGALSKHFSGHAWDVQPMTGSQGAAVQAFIHSLPGLQKFLTQEGGLVRWHAQFVA